VIDTNAHEAIIGRQIIHTVGDRFADCVREKILHIYQLGLPLQLPLTTCVFEITNQLLLLCIDGND
jgi:hypothetical protein